MGADPLEMLKRYKISNESILEATGIKKSTFYTRVKDYTNGKFDGIEPDLMEFFDFICSSEPPTEIQVFDKLCEIRDRRPSEIDSPTRAGLETLNTVLSGDNTFYENFSVITPDSPSIDRRPIDDRSKNISDDLREQYTSYINGAFNLHTKIRDTLPSFVDPAYLKYSYPQKSYVSNFKLLNHKDTTRGEMLDARAQLKLIDGCLNSSLMNRVPIVSVKFAMNVLKSAISDLDYVVANITDDSDETFIKKVINDVNNGAARPKKWFLAIAVASETIPEDSDVTYYMPLIYQIFDCDKDRAREMMVRLIREENPNQYAIVDTGVLGPFDSDTQLDRAADFVSMSWKMETDGDEYSTDYSYVESWLKQLIDNEKILRRADD